MHEFLRVHGVEALLSDPLLDTATAEIEARDRPRAEVQADLKRKEAARKALGKKYARGQLKPDDVLDAVYSFSDNNTYLLFNRDPVDRMIGYLRAYFDPRVPGEHSLAIASGACLCCELVTWCVTYCAL